MEAVERGGGLRGQCGAVARWALLALWGAVLLGVGAMVAVLILRLPARPATPAPLPSRPPTASPAPRLSSPDGARLVLRQPGKIMKPGKLEWYADNRMNGVYLGPGFDYDRAFHMLKIKNHGLYYIYAQLSASRVLKSSCKEEGNATLTIHQKISEGSVPILTLPLHLSSSSNKLLAAFTAVSPYHLAEGDFLYVMLTVGSPVEAGQCKSTQWYFGEGTVFGLSRISGNCNSEATGISGCSPADLGVDIERSW